MQLFHLDFTFDKDRLADKYVIYYEDTKEMTTQDLHKGTQQLAHFEMECIVDKVTDKTSQHSAEKAVGKGLGLTLTLNLTLPRKSSGERTLGCWHVIYYQYIISLFKLGLYPRQRCQTPPSNNTQRGYPVYDTELRFVVKLLFWNSEGCGVLLHCHYSQVHPDLELSYLPTPPLGQDMIQGQFFKRSLTGLNSEFSFS